MAGPLAASGLYQPQRQLRSGAVLTWHAHALCCVLLTARAHCLQLKQLFGFCGTVKDCRFECIARTYAFVEMATEEVRT